jgi:hypothetical protein
MYIYLTLSKSLSPDSTKANDSRLLIFTMAPSFPITEAELTGSFSESVLWGFHIITLGFCMQALLRSKNQWKKSRDVNWAMVGVSLALFVNASFDVLLGFYHTLLAFVFFQGEGGATGAYTDISEWINIARVRTHYCSLRSWHAYSIMLIYIFLDCYRNCSDYNRGCSPGINFAFVVLIAFPSQPLICRSTDAGLYTSAPSWSSPYLSSSGSL